MKSSIAPTKMIKFVKFAGLTMVVSALLIAATLPTVSVANLPERQELPLPNVNNDAPIQKQTKPAPSNRPAGWVKHHIKIGKNESLGTALNSLKISANTTHNISTLKDGHLLTNLNVGDELVVWVDQNDTLQKILYPKTQLLSYELIKTDTGYSIDEKKSNVEIRTQTAYGTINNSFYVDAQNAGLSAKSIMSLSDLFGWDIDFSRELREGDTFKVIYETRYLKNQYIGDGDILAAQITTNNRQTRHNAFIQRDAKNQLIGYYNEEGKNLKKAFLRSPVDYVRITSKFNPKRFHPVLKEWRAHRGVDYGGPIGTPIRATGNGKVVFAGWGKGYGNHVKIQHAGKYLTLYGHLSKFGNFKQGSTIKQGDILGYLGQTGLATGPHLHYEFRINDVHVDPLNMKFPGDVPLDKKYHASFTKQAKFLLSQLDRTDAKTHLVQNFE
ncbi:M23 family metallopeptidase [Thiomicrorhabdus aquaedulcis]|uniref:M23 family metallopeptidase n=1 Tax=Thiomicrorhabdus aquaedulcis TaxID=2211106 RepID=UPI001E408A45|nr:peptidoglycan DD-metalloendopeptidase family protein [Thiomicrorhabdus aquaedulcis]